MKLSPRTATKNVEDNFHSGHVGDAESLEHDVRHALAARLQDRRRQVQTAETSTS